jgi:tetratricopeptide (TPR) repeat protein
MLLCAVSSWAQQDWEATAKRAILKADWSEVAEAAQRWKQRDAGAAVADWLLGYAGLATGNSQVALAGFSQLDTSAKKQSVSLFASALVSQAPSNAIAQMLKGDVLARAGNYAEALTALDKAAQLDPGSALILDVRGVVRALAGKREDAFADFALAVELKPKFADAHANLGLARLAVGSVSGAVGNFTQAIELAPDFALAYNGRGVAYALMEAWDEAESDFKKAAELAPGLSYTHGNTQFLTWGKGQIAFRQSLQERMGDGRGGTLIAKSFVHQMEDVGGGKMIDVFIIKPTPLTNTFEGMKAVTQEITRQLRVRNDLPDSWQPRFHLDAHGFNSTPYANDQKSYAAMMAQQSGRDALVMMDFSPYYKGTGPLGSLPNALTWHWRVTDAAEQLARADAAINVVTGNKPSFTGYSGGAEAHLRMGEVMSRLPLEVSSNIGFDNVLLSAYPFQKTPGAPVEVPDVLLKRIDGKVYNFYSSGPMNNRLAAGEKVINIPVPAVRHVNFNDVTLPDGRPNPVAHIGGAMLREREPSASLRDDQIRPVVSLPSVRAVARNLDRFYQVVGLLYKITNTDMPMEMKAPLALSGSIIQDINAAQAGKFHPLTSRSLEAIGKFGLKELPKLVNELVADGKLPGYYKDYLSSPLMKGLPDFLAASASQAGRGSYTPNLDEISRYAEGSLKVTGAIIGALYIKRPEGAEIGATVAGLTADAVKGISESLGRNSVLREGGTRLVQEWNTHVQAATARGLEVKSFSEMYGIDNLMQMGFNTRSIAEYDNLARWANTTTRVTAGKTSPTVDLLQASIPTRVIPALDESWKKPDLPWRRRDLPPRRSDLYLGPLPPGGPPPPPAIETAAGAMRQSNPPPPRAKSADAPSYRLPSTAVAADKRGGVAMHADVVKNERADTSDLFGSSPDDRLATIRQDGLFSPFLLFCALKPGN